MRPDDGPVLVVLAGLPASGKSSIAKRLAQRLGAAYVRVDTIEQAIADVSGRQHPVGETGYCVGYAVAADQLRTGLSVVADSVNPLAVTRAAWCDIGERYARHVLEVEVVCSDPQEHRRRAQTRTVDVPGLVPPTWDEILQREYEPWNTPRLQVDTAVADVDACVAQILEQT